MVREEVVVSTPKIKAIDFFCGAGGLTRGLLDAGIEVLAGVDNDERLRKTYESNNSSKFVCEDVENVDIQALRADLGITSEDTVLYAACTPCQPFSTLNQRRGKDDRKSLLLSFGEIVRAAPPDYIAVENVPGLNNAYGREVYDSFIEILDECALVHRDGALLDAKDYGVPQIRKRFIMLGSKLGPIALPKRRPGRKPTVRTALKRFPSPVFDGEPEIPNHVAREPKPHHLKILEAVPHDGGNRSDIEDTSILLPCHRRNPKLHKDVFGRMAWAAPAPTLTCRCTDVYCGRFAHPEQDRGLSLREAAAIQTFRDDYVFHGSFFHAAAQIGNAVPVRLAERLGKAVLASLVA
jgi:DNA (cytosine-5)-methyltransferase 1